MLTQSLHLASPRHAMQKRNLPYNHAKISYYDYKSSFSLSIPQEKQVWITSTNASDAEFNVETKFVVTVAWTCTEKNLLLYNDQTHHCVSRY